MPTAPRNLWKVRDNARVDDVRLAWPNLRGLPDDMDRKGGVRKTAIVLPPEVGQRMLEDGWNVKYKPPLEDGGDPLYYIRAKASWDFAAPKIWLVANGRRTLLDEETVGEIDTAKIETVDVILSPYNWINEDNEVGVTAYIKTMYVTISLDELEQKYANVPDVNDDGPREPREDTPPW